MQIKGQFHLFNKNTTCVSFLQIKRYFTGNRFNIYFIYQPIYSCLCHYFISKFTTFFNFHLQIHDNWTSCFNPKFSHHPTFFNGRTNRILGQIWFPEKKHHNTSKFLTLNFCNWCLIIGNCWNLLRN